MTKYVKIGALLSVVGLALAGCGDPYSVQQSEATAEVTPQSSYISDFVEGPAGGRLSICFWSPCPYTVTVDHTPYVEVVEGKYFIEQSDVDLTMDISITGRLKTDDESRKALMTSSVPDQTESSDRHKVYKADVLFNKLIAVPLKDAIRQGLNSTMVAGPDGKERQLSIEDAMGNSSFLKANVVLPAVQKLAANTPFEITNVTLAKIDYPPSIKEKKEKIRNIEDNKLIRLKEAEAEIDIMEQRRLVRIRAAEIDLELDRMISPYMNKELAMWQYLQTLDLCAQQEDCDMTAFPPDFSILDGTSKEQIAKTLSAIKKN